MKEGFEGRKSEKRQRDLYVSEHWRELLSTYQKKGGGVGGAGDKNAVGIDELENLH